MKTLASIVLVICTALAAHAQVRISELPEATNAAGAQFVIIQGGATKRIAEGTVRTIPATNVTGLGPFAISTNLAISNITGLQVALDGKLATNGTLPADNITGLGPFATATNLTAAQIGDFSNAVVAVAPPTTNASLLTTGTLEDARLSTNIARTSQLVASNIGGLGPFSTATNLTSMNISDFPAAVQALLANTSIVWSTVPLATNSFGTAGQIAYTDNALYICVDSNQWRRVLLGTWE